MQGNAGRARNTPSLDYFEGARTLAAGRERAAVSDESCAGWAA